MYCDHCGKYTERMLFGVPQCFAYDPRKGHDVVRCTPADPEDFQQPDDEDYEDYADTHTAYSSANGLRIYAATHGVPLRTFLATVSDHWPVKVPSLILDRPENVGLAAECFTRT